MTSAIRDVIVDYTNWKGDRRERLIRPLCITFGNNEYHKERQWLVKARDLEDNVIKYFALSNIHSWRSRT